MIHYWPINPGLHDFVQGGQPNTSATATLADNRFGWTKSSLDINGWYLKTRPNYYFGGDFTISAWVWAKNFTSGARIIDCGNGANMDNVVFSYSWLTTGKPFLFIVNQNDSSANMISPVAILTQTWTFLAATLEGNTLKLYINGQFIISWNTNIVPEKVTRSACYFGFTDFSGVDPAYMYLDEIKIFDRSLQSNEVLKDYSASSY